VASENFSITKDLLQMDEDMVRKQVKDVEHMELVLAKVPTKALYKLQMSITQEVQSRARTNATNLETSKEEKEVLEIALKEVQIECKEEKKRADKLEQRLEEVFQMIPDSALGGEISAEENIKRIV
jgi:hypothetical protein